MSFHIFSLSFLFSPFLFSSLPFFSLSFFSLLSLLSLLSLFCLLSLVEDLWSSTFREFLHGILETRNHHECKKKQKEEKKNGKLRANDQKIALNVESNESLFLLRVFDNLLACNRALLR